MISKALIIAKDFVLSRGNIEKASMWVFKYLDKPGRFWQYWKFLQFCYSISCFWSYFCHVFMGKTVYQIVVSTHYSVRTKDLISIIVRKRSLLAFKMYFLDQNSLNVHVSNTWCKPLIIAEYFSTLLTNTLLGLGLNSFMHTVIMVFQAFLIIIRFTTHITNVFLILKVEK